MYSTYLSHSRYSSHYTSNPKVTLTNFKHNLQINANSLSLSLFVCFCYFGFTFLISIEIFWCFSENLLNGLRQPQRNRQQQQQPRHRSCFTTTLRKVFLPHPPFLHKISNKSYYWFHMKAFSRFLHYFFFTRLWNEKMNSRQIIRQSTDPPLSIHWPFLAIS